MLLYVSKKTMSDLVKTGIDFEDDTTHLLFNKDYVIFPLEGNRWYNIWCRYKCEDRVFILSKVPKGICGTIEEIESKARVQKTWKTSDEESFISVVKSLCR